VLLQLSGDKRGAPPQGLMETTVGEQKRRNPRLTKPKAEFCEIMKNLGLPYPKKLGACVCVCVVF